MYKFYSLRPLFLNAARARIRSGIGNKIRGITGRPLRADASANFYLFALACLYRDEFEIDQVIHEFGDPGQPAWIHLNSSNDANRGKRQILRIDSRRTRILNLEQALALGC